MIDVPMSSPRTAMTASGAGVGATKALVESSEQAVTVPNAYGLLPLFLATDLISGVSKTRATSENTGYRNDITGLWRAPCRSFTADDAKERRCDTKAGFGFFQIDAEDRSEDHQ